MAELKDDKASGMRERQDSAIDEQKTSNVRKSTSPKPSNTLSSGGIDAAEKKSERKRKREQSVSDESEGSQAGVGTDGIDKRIKRSRISSDMPRIKDEPLSDDDLGFLESSTGGKPKKPSASTGKTVPGGKKKLDEVKRASASPAPSTSSRHKKASTSTKGFFLGSEERREKQRASDGKRADRRQGLALEKKIQKNFADLIDPTQQSAGSYGTSTKFLPGNHGYKKIIDLQVKISECYDPPTKKKLLAAIPNIQKTCTTVYTKILDKLEELCKKCRLIDDDVQSEDDWTAGDDDEDEDADNASSIGTPAPSTGKATASTRGKTPKTSGPSGKQEAVSSTPVPASRKRKPAPAIGDDVFGSSFDEVDREEDGIDEGESARRRQAVSAKPPAALAASSRQGGSTGTRKLFLENAAAREGSQLGHTHAHPPARPQSTSSEVSQHLAAGTIDVPGVGRIGTPHGSTNTRVPFAGLREHDGSGGAVITTMTPRAAGEAHRALREQRAEAERQDAARLERERAQQQAARDRRNREFRNFTFSFSRASTYGAIDEDAMQPRGDFPSRPSWVTGNAIVERHEANDRVFIGADLAIPQPERYKPCFYVNSSTQTEISAMPVIKSWQRQTIDVRERKRIARDTAFANMWLEAHRSVDPTFTAETPDTTQGYINWHEKQLRRAAREKQMAEMRRQMEELEKQQMDD